MLEQETPNIASMASLPTLSAPGLLVMDVDSTLIDVKPQASPIPL